MSLHGGNIREATQKYKITRKNILDFSANINPLGFPPGLKRFIADNLDIIPYYPDPDCRTIKDSLSQYLQISEDNLLIGNGSIELIFLITQSLKPKKVLIPTPTFSEYERAVAVTSGKCLFLETSEENDFVIKAEQIIKKLTSVDLVFICNPNNPTGFLFTKEAVERLVRECERRGVFLVIDEAFLDFVVEKDDVSMLQFAARHKYTLVLQSLTKFFAIAGLRLGYLIGDKNLIKRISWYQPPWSVNSLAQLAGDRILKNSSFIKKSRLYISEQRNELLAELKKLKYLQLYPPSANFIFCKLKTSQINATQLCDYCGKRGLLIRNCDNFRGLDNSFIRIAVRKKEENRKLVGILKGLS